MRGKKRTHLIKDVDVQYSRFKVSTFCGRTISREDLRGQDYVICPGCRNVLKELQQSQPLPLREEE